MHLLCQYNLEIVKSIAGEFYFKACTVFEEYPEKYSIGPNDKFIPIIPNEKD